MEIKKVIRMYYILSCLFSAGGVQIIGAIYVSFLMKNNLNLLEVNLVNAVFFTTLFLCEVPTGAFADIFGRKTAFVSSCVLMSASMFIYGSSSSFAGFALAEALAAISATFRNGAFQAWLVDSLKHVGHTNTDEYRHIFAREFTLRQISGCLSSIVGAYIAVSNMYLPWFIGGFVMVFVAAAAYIIMDEPYFVRKKFSPREGIAAMVTTARISITSASNNKAVRFILIVTCLQIFCMQALNMYWQPMFKSVGLAEQYLGYVFTAMMIGLAAGSYLTSRIKHIENEKRGMAFVLACIGVLIVLAAILPGLWFTLFFFVLHEIPRGAIPALIDSYLQKRIPSSERATITSFCAIAPHIGGAVGLVISGFIAQNFGIATAWVVSGTVLILGALLIRRKSD